MESILQKKVSRKDFLIMAAMVLLSLTGIKGILDVVNNKGPVTKGFGNGPYGV